MKKTLLVATFALFQYSSFAQKRAALLTDTDIKIDPRQYVLVKYKKSVSGSKLDTIWNWENRNDIPNQKFRIIDIDGEIRIEFLKLGIIRNQDFEGTVSLEAEISGTNGTRKIEVNPYSEIGVQRIPIGIKSEPPSEISRKLLNMIRELRDAENVYNSIAKKDRGFFDTGFLSRDAVIQEKITDLYKEIKNSKAALDQNLLDDGIELVSLMNRQYSNIPRVKLIGLLTKDQFKASMDSLTKGYNTWVETDKSDFTKLFTGYFNYCSKKTDLILQYLGSFESSGEDASKAFLSLINKDAIGYKVLKDNFVSYQKNLAKIDLTDKNLTVVLANNRDLIIQCCKALSELSKFKGSIFESILDRSLNSSQTSSSKAYILDPEKADSINRDRYFKLLDDSLQTISERLSLAAGRIIYKKLIYATIDLGKSGAKSGEVMNIYLTWILDSKRDSLANSPRLPIGKFYIKETGWKTEVADMFSLVKRVHEPDATNTNLSPSNFKGAGGAVLMWTYHAEDHGINVTTKNNQVRVSRRNGFANFLEPSIGLNVSYLDFSTDKDVEIGTGLQVGLFNNKIFFGYGVNLQLISPAHQSPTYFFLGFSFAKLSELFKTSTVVSSSQ